MPFTLHSNHLLRCLPIDKSQRLIPTNSVNSTSLVMERNAVALVCHKQHLRSESCANELSTHASCVAIILRGLLSRDVLKHLCNGGTILGVEVCVDFIEEIEGRRIALLDCKDESEGAETW